MKKLTIASNKFNSSRTKDYYTGISNNKRNEFQSFNVSKNVAEKIISCLNIIMAAGTDQVAAKFLKEACRYVSLSIV